MQTLYEDMQTLAVIRTFTCMSEFPMILMFQHTKLKPASRLISRPEFILTHLLHSNIQSYRVCLDRCVMPTQMFHLCQQEKKDWRTGDFGIRFDLRHSSRARVEVGQSSIAPDLTFSDPDDCQHFRTSEECLTFLNSLVLQPELGLRAACTKVDCGKDFQKTLLV